MTCRLCGSNDLKLFYTQGNRHEFKYYRCSACRLVNLDLAHGLNQEKYGDVFIEHEDEAAKQNRTQARSWRFIRGYLPQGLTGKVLDIGCGNGALLRMARNDGWSITGIELLKSLAEGASRSLGLEIIQGDFLEYTPEHGENHDLIVMRHVLEHMPDCRAVVSRCRELLSPGGYLYLELPNINGLTFRMKRMGERFGIHRHRYREDYVPGHCNEFCRYSIDYLARESGLELVHWSTYSSKRSLDWLYGFVPIATKARAILASS